MLTLHHLRSIIHIIWLRNIEYISIKREVDITSGEYSKAADSVSCSWFACPPPSGYTGPRPFSAEAGEGSGNGKENDDEQRNFLYSAFSAHLSLRCPRESCFGQIRAITAFIRDRPGEVRKARADKVAVGARMFPILVKNKKQPDCPALSQIQGYGAGLGPNEPVSCRYSLSSRPRLIFSAKQGQKAD